MSLRFNTFRIPAAALWVAAGILLSTTARAATSPAAAAAVVTEYGAMFQSQGPDGAFAFDGSQRFFRDYPVLAALCIESNNGSPNAAFVSQSASALGRYYNYLFGARDRNHNLLIETSAPGPDGKAVDIEDVGFNSLLALDMLSLARLNLEIKRPYVALYWYEGSRAVQDAVIYASYDRHARYFFPSGTNGRRNTSRHGALSALPLLFQGRVGDNDAAIVARQHLLDPQPRTPESPFDYLGAPMAFGSDEVASAASLLKTSLLIDVLAERGFDDDAAVFRAQAVDRARAAIDAATSGGRLPAGHLELLAERLESGEQRPLFDPWCALELFGDMIRATGRMEDIELVRVAAAIADARHFVETAPGVPVNPGDITRAETSIRTLYQALSKVRDQLDAKTPLPSDAYRAVGGMDPVLAMEHLLDDVAFSLQRCDNEVFRRSYGDGGLRLSASLLNENTVLGGSVRVRWTLEAQNAPLPVASATILVGDAVYPLVADTDELVLRPGTPMTKEVSLAIDHGRVDTIEPLTLTLDIVDGSGKRIRFHAFRTVYLEHPISVMASFPEGRMLTGETLPIDVTMVNRTQEPATIQYDWYSPTGLRLVEGRSAEYTMEADQGADTTMLRLNVSIPPRCRPGRFPFKLKFYADGNDIGTVSSEFFRPYQWAAIGPFTPEGDAASTPFPAGQRIDLLADYAGQDGRVAWTVVDTDAYTPDGDVSLHGVMPRGHRGGTAFLYTVIEAPDVTSAPVFLAANSPATLIVNGASVIELAPGSGPAYARVELSQGANEFLIKVVGDASSRASFTLGDENDETSYGFNNNMWELAAGYTQIYRRSRGHELPPQESQKVVTLRYRDPTAHAVAVIGTFNGWSPDQSPMRRLDSGVWEIVLTLPPGKHAYRFLVNNRNQVVDPMSRIHEPDGFGGENSILFVE